jgi:hypothetical protein
MRDFEWTVPLSVEEISELRGYKDFTWKTINPRLRSGTALGNENERVILLDQAIEKGRCTQAVTLFRATGSDFVVIENNIIRSDNAFVSTSLDDKCMGQFFESSPVKLIIECPRHTAMAAFEHDDAGGEEQERLLPRRTRFRVKSHRIVPNKLDVYTEEGPFNRHYMQVEQRFGRQASICIYTVEPI